MTSKALLPLTLAGVLSLTSVSRADDPVSKFASSGGTLIYLAAGTLASSFEDGKAGKEHTARTVDALVTTTLITEALKATVREKRPESSSRSSFPSGHTSAAFAVAAMESHYHPYQAPYWYAGAAIIGASRVTLHEHYVHDVLAGAVQGYFTSRWELKSKHGLILLPIIRNMGDDSNSRSARNLGVGIAGTF